MDKPYAVSRRPHASRLEVTPNRAIVAISKWQDLRLGRNQLAEPGAIAISRGLSENSTLTRLDLSGNLLNAAAAATLARALFPHHAPPSSAPTTTVASSIDADEPNEDTGSAGAQPDQSTPRTSASSCAPPLEFLDLSRNPLGDEGGAVLFRAIASATAAATEAVGEATPEGGDNRLSTPYYSIPLRSLSIAEAGLGPQAAAALADALAPATITSTTTLNAVKPSTSTSDSNGQGGEPPGQETPSQDAVSSMRSEGVGGDRGSCGEGTVGGLSFLKTLDLSKNDFGTDGAGKLAEALRRGGGLRLESLSLGYNGIGDDGAKAIGQAAGEGLRVLDFSGNGLSPVGLAGVLSAVGLREAKLFHNSCGDEG